MNMPDVQENRGGGIRQQDRYYAYNVLDKATHRWHNIRF